VIVDDQHYLRVRERTCDRKIRYGPRLARSTAARMRGQGENVSAYRCPFSAPETHWHVGHMPSMESLQELADAVRYALQEL
jgi:hypothetical protein